MAPGDPNYIKVYVIDYGKARKYLMLQWTDPKTGKRKSESSKCTNQRAAAIKAQAKEKELNAGIVPVDGALTWETFIDKHQTEVLSGVADRTHEKVSSIFKVMAEFEKPTLVREITSQYVSRYVGWLRMNKRSESTIQSHLRHLKAVFRWAVENNHMAIMPTIPAIPRASKRKLMKGRPITDEEFNQFVKCIPGNVDAGQEQNWIRMARGLWLSGLRIEESMSLSWDTNSAFHVFFSRTGRPQLRIPDWAEKGHEDRIYPITPDFAEFLLSIPEAERVGWVFNPTFINHRNAKVERYKSSREAGRVFSAAGATAKIVVHTSQNGKQKFASAHDLRRSFGSRWSRLVTPNVLRELMRHATIQTTMAFYVGDDADRTQDEAYRAWAVRQDNSKDNTKPAKSKKTQKTP